MSEHSSGPRSSGSGASSSPAATRLAVYGSLTPGGPNHHVLADLDGHWISGTVRGHLREAGWGAALGYPGLVLDGDGPVISVSVLHADGLVDRWGDLDAFEGPSYRRERVLVSTEDGEVEAQIYVLSGV